MTEMVCARAAIDLEAIKNCRSSWRTLELGCTGTHTPQQPTFSACALHPASRKPFLLTCSCVLVQHKSDKMQTAACDPRCLTCPWSLREGFQSGHTEYVSPKTWLSSWEKQTPAANTQLERTLSLHCRSCEAILEAALICWAVHWRGRGYGKLDTTDAVLGQELQAGTRLQAQKMTLHEHM